MMRKTPVMVNFQFLTLALVVLCLFLIPINIYAEMFYRCIDKGGNEVLSDTPVDGQNCKQIEIYEEMTNAKNEDEKIKEDNKTTKIVIRGNSILVPVTLVDGRNEVKVHLLLDTGATGTTIYTEIADKLSINKNKTTKIKGQVVGGGIIDASMIRIDSLTVGPHTADNFNIYIVPHQGLAVKHDGLLGMDLLREFKYKIDFKKQVIIWE